MNLSDIVKSHKAHSETINQAAKNLRDVMVECGIHSLTVNDCMIRVREVKANSGACHDQIEMGVRGGWAGFTDTWVCLQDKPSATNECYYDYGDFNCRSVRPTREQLLKFNSNTLAFIDKIASMQE